MKEGDHGCIGRAALSRVGEVLQHNIHKDTVDVIRVG